MTLVRSLGMIWAGLVAIGAVACGAPGQDPQPSASDTHPAIAEQAAAEQPRLFKGEEIYRGIFRASGPVAKLFPEVVLEENPASPEHATLAEWKSELKARVDATGTELKIRPKLIAHLDRFIEHRKQLPKERTDAQEARGERKLVWAIRRADATFFPRFGADMQSGDAARIEQALTEAEKVTFEVTARGLPRANSRSVELGAGGCSCACSCGACAGGTCGSCGVCGACAGGTCAGACAGSCAGSCGGLCIGACACGGGDCGLAGCGFAGCGFGECGFGECGNTNGNLGPGGQVGVAGPGATAGSGGTLGGMGVGFDRVLPRGTTRHNLVLAVVTRLVAH